MSKYCCDYGCNQGRDCPARATPLHSSNGDDCRNEWAEIEAHQNTPEFQRSMMNAAWHSGNGGNTIADGKSLQKELPIVMSDDSLFDMVDGLIVVVRWPLLCFAVVAMVLFIVAMILHLPWAK